MAARSAFSGRIRLPRRVHELYLLGCVAQGLPGYAITHAVHGNVDGLLRILQCFDNARQVRLMITCGENDRRFDIIGSGVTFVECNIGIPVVDG